ncbi:MAG: 16S rRNA (cytosine(1402)-N(4))-methyltransferase RsmH [Pirellulales bacterium]|nr:16S rRNA (cytosine(1402)-N(4))-methyltransferase RsmH [Pirellulales bacterium]
MAEKNSVHIPVLFEAVVLGLEPKPGMVIVDGTLGGGGHSRALAERIVPGGTLIALDRDPAAIDAGERFLRGLPVRLAQANFCDLPEVLKAVGAAYTATAGRGFAERVDGVLLDLGLSSDQLADASRGFSFSSDGPLDLRFDPTAGVPAWRLLERLSAEHLADLIFEFGEERFSRRIAKAIVERRRGNPVRTSRDLAELIGRCVPKTRDSERIHPATRTFQALRIAVNDELKSLEIALRRIPDCLNPGGRFAIISFHSLEDRRVKEAFQNDARLKVLTRRPIRADESEISQNPRSRSAKLRIAERMK